MWVADKLVYRSESDFIRAYKGSELVWELPSGLYYVSWTPSSLSGSFTLFGQTYNMQDYMGYYDWKESGVITSSAFQSTGIKTISTNVSGIDYGAFGSCILLSQVSLPMCSYIGDAAFQDCPSLSQVSLPMCSYIGEAAFNECKSLSQISIPMCSYIGSYAFRSCGSLKQVSLPKCSYIGNYAFLFCYKLNTITLGYSSVCSLDNSNVFSRTQITSSTGDIYVPASLVNAYKSASGWSVYSKRIYSIR